MATTSRTRIYTGDLYGTLYRVDGIGKGPDAGGFAAVQVRLPTRPSPDEHPIRGKASNGLRQECAGELWVYFGTGRYETQADAGTSLTTQYFLRA
jgi:Tfp pilus tip-associated adhesin PilY1